MYKRMILICAFILAGCSNKAIYENIQSNNRNTCLKGPQADYEDCIKRNSKSYENYEKELKEVSEQ